MELVFKIGGAEQNPSWVTPVLRRPSVVNKRMISWTENADESCILGWFFVLMISAGSEIYSGL